MTQTESITSAAPDSRRLKLFVVLKICLCFAAAVTGYLLSLQTLTPIDWQLTFDFRDDSVPRPVTIELLNKTHVVGTLLNPIRPNDATKTYHVLVASSELEWETLRIFPTDEGVTCDLFIRLSVNGLPMTRQMNGDFIKPNFFWTKNSQAFVIALTIFFATAAYLVHCAFAPLAILTPLIGVFGPGCMSVDSFAQLGEARSGLYSDWHPPIMAILWAGLDSLIPGPILMMIFHASLFLIGTFVLSITLFERNWSRGLFVLAFGYFPAFFPFLGTIWKDVGFGSSLFLGSAVILWTTVKTPSTRLLAASRAVSLLAISYALAIRHNAAPAILPIILWWLLSFRYFSLTTWKYRLRTLIVAGTVTGLLIVSLQLFNKWLVEDRATFPMQVGLLQDLSVLSLYENKLLLPKSAWPEKMNAEQVFAYIKAIDQQYQCKEGYCWLFFLTYPRLSPAMSKEVWQAWFQAIWDDPAAFLDYRWHLLDAVYHYYDSRPDTYFYGMVQNDIGLTFEPREISSTANKFLSWQGFDWAFKGWIYFLVATVSLITSMILTGFGRVGLHPVALLSCSSLFYSIPYAFIWPFSEFRYHWWSAISAVVAVILLLSPKMYRSRRNEVP